jgi:hypothetical protein
MWKRMAIKKHRERERTQSKSHNDYLLKGFKIKEIIRKTSPES